LTGDFRCLILAAMRSLLLLSLIVAPLARADEPPPPAAAPPAPAALAAPPPAAAPSAPALAAPPPAAPTDELPPLKIAGYEALAGFGAAAVTTPAMMEIQAAIGRSTPNLVAALLPGLLLTWLVPPAAVTLVEWLLGRRLTPGRAHVHPVIWAGVGLQLVAIVVGSLAGVWTGDATSFTLFTLADALALPAAVTAVMRWRPGKPKRAPAAHARADERPFLARERESAPRTLSAPAFPILAVSF
jgi:hypothetical protein